MALENPFLVYHLMCILQKGFLCLYAYKCLIHLIIEILFVQLYYAELSLSHSATRSLVLNNRDVLLENLKKITF